MIAPPKPQFDWGQKVTAVADLFNDGSHPHHPDDALLVSAGEIGEIIQVGCHKGSGAFVYMVEFSRRQVVGCMEPELMHLIQIQEAR
jgi:nitrogen fixation protein NifZ